MEDYPNVDGVIPSAQGRLRRALWLADLFLFQRTLAGIVHHPNVAAYVILVSAAKSTSRPT